MRPSSASQNNYRLVAVVTGSDMSADHLWLVLIGQVPLTGPGQGHGVLSFGVKGKETFRAETSTRRERRVM